MVEDGAWAWAAGEGGLAGSLVDVHHAAVPARPEWLSVLRTELAAWAARVGLDETRIEAVVLTGYEAAANVVEHAYPGGPGELELHALYRSDPPGVELVVADRGGWQPAPVDPGFRGRGLLLMRRLCDRVEIRAGEEGTTVHLFWDLSDLPDPNVTGSDER